MDAFAPPYTDEIQPGDLPLAEGATLTFRFDVGAEWRFGIEVASIVPSEDGPSEVQLLDVTGAPPAQCSASCCPRRNAVRAPRVC